MKKILHLFSDPSHSALWSRYLRMLTLIALLAFGSHGVWGLGIKRNVSMTNVEVATPNGTFKNDVYTWTGYGSNLIQFKDLDDSDLSEYEKIVVPVSNWNTGVLRCVIRVENEGGGTTDYTWTLHDKNLSLKELQLVGGSFYNEKTKTYITKNQLKKVKYVFFGGADANGSATIGQIYLTKQLDWDENGKITILPQDINCGENVTRSSNSFKFDAQNASVTIDFIGDGISAKKLASASSSPTNPGFNFYYCIDNNYQNDKSSTSELGESNVIKVKYACNTNPTTITINNFVLTYNAVKKTIVVDGNTREYYVYVPSKANVATKDIPVIFSLHGRYNKANPADKSGKPNFNDIADADENGIIVVYPQGRSGADKDKYSYKGNWYDGFADCTGWEATGKENGDTHFIEKLVEQIKTDYPQANPERFYLCGFSMGGMMTYAFANACPNIFAAYASTGGYPINEFHLDLANINRSPFLHIHPKDDNFVVYSKLETIKRNMVARYGHNWTNSYRDGNNIYDIQDFKSNTDVGALKYIEIDKEQNLGHSIAPYAPNMMYDFFKDKAYVDYSKHTKEWSWDMDKFTTGGWDIGNNVISFGNNVKTDKNQNVYPCIQLPAGKHIIYAKINMAPSEENAYLTLKNNISGVEIVARKLKNNSGSSVQTDKFIAYEFETGANGEFSVYVGREKDATSCKSLSIYKSPTTLVTESDESIDNSKIDITGHLLKIDFEELKRNSSDTKGTKTATLLKSGDYGMSCVQPSSGYEYYYANRLERKNDKYHYDVVANDKVFENYFQNMPHADIYERTSGEDFMRIMIPEGTLNTVAEKGTITIGFWVNANLAVDRGLSYCQQSMFYLAGDKFNGWNTDHPDDVKSEEYNAYMFNITCNGGISGYMRYDDNGETKVAAYAGGTAFGGFCDTEIDAFYKKNHYMDGNWHYITFQMYDNLSRYNMYVDGLPATLGGYSPSDKPEVLKKGISGLKSIVLGGLNARNSEWSYDVAFAYDDIVIYDRVLSQAEIKKIISEKKYTPSWNFKRNLSNANLFDAGKIKKSSIWTQEENGVYSLNKPLSAKASLTYDDNEEIPAFKGLSFTTKAANQIKIDTSNGTLNVSSGAAVCFKNISKDNYLRFTTQSTFANDYSEISLSGVHDKFLECPVTLFKAGEKSTGSGYNGNPTITMNNDVVIYSILRTDKQFAQMWCEKAGKITKTYSYNSSTPATNDPEKTSMIKLTDLPEIILFVNGTKRDLPSPDWKFKYSSSAPQVANVDQNKGYVTITGIPGSAVITVELVNKDDKNETVHGNDALYERTDRIFASYEIINRQEDNTFVVSKGEKYSNNRSFTLTETTDEVTKTTVSVTLGGWKYGTEYQGQRDDYSSAEELSGVDCFGFSDITTENERFTELFKDGKSISTNGTYAAKSESWVKNVNESGLYKPNEANTITNNTTPWTIPCRGTHIKVEPEYPGIMSVYVLQKGCVTERGEDNKPISVNLNQVYITDETGKSIREVICDTKTRVADQIWKNDGRARAEYTYNDVKYAITPGIFNSFRNNIEERQRWAFLDNWDNPGMTGHVFCTDYYDDKRGVGIEGHVLISTGIVKYTFNVVPGKTYYLFSNNSPLGFAGFSFDKNKHLNIVEVQGRKYSYLVANNNNPTALKEMASDITISNDNVSQLASSVCSSEIPLPYYDEITQSLTGDSKIKKYVPGTMAKITYNRAFTEGVWSSICLPYSISNRQMEEQFGEGTQVVLLNKIYDKDGHGIVQFIWHANQDIIAGYPYLILPMKTKSQIVTNSTIELKDNPLFSVTEGQKTIAYDNSNSESGYVFKGNFEEETIPVGSYVLNTSGKLARVGAAGLKLKPFRAYLRNNAGLNAKLLTTMAFSGWDDLDDLDNTTSIDEILEENGIFTKGANVYDLNGVLVRKNTHTIQGLPKGIYIVNGKKYVVK